MRARARIGMRVLNLFDDLINGEMTLLRSGEAPDGFRRAPAPMLPMPIALTRPTRAAAARTNDAIISTNAELRNTTKLGRRFCEVTNFYI